MLNKKVEINETNNFLKAEIKKGCSLKKLNKELNDLNISDKNKRIIIGAIINYNPNIINENKKINALKIYLIKDNEKEYEIIIENKNNLLISEKIINDNISETSVEIKNDNYLICKLIHDINGSTKSIKRYSSDDVDNYNNMDKKEAFKACKNMLDSLWKKSSLQDIINIADLYKRLNIITPNKNNPVISDEVINLCSLEKEENINDKTFCDFNIVLNDTFEVVGNISFNYSESGSSELGNVIYNVKKEYENNHFCTRALALLKKLLKNNNYDGDKSLYLATINEASTAIAKANGGIPYESYYKDESEDDFESLFDGTIKEEPNSVTIFKINL